MTEENVVIPANLIAVSGQTVDASLHPKDDPKRLFRDSWVLEEGVIVINLSKARAIQLDRLRAERKPLLEDLDTQLTRSEEIENDVERDKVRKEIFAKKKALRDITKDERVLTARTPDELSALTIESLLSK